MNDFLGESKTATFTLVDEAGAPVAGTVAWTITRPDGTTVVPTTANPVLGTYTAEWILDQIGRWLVHVESSGAVVAVADETVDVETAQDYQGAPRGGPCADWATWAEVEATCTPPPDLPVAIQELVLATTSEILWRRTGEQFGICTITARPLVCCRHRRPRCSCGVWNAARLGHAPIVAVHSVLVDGVAVPPSSYRVDEWEWLVRTDGEAWPICNDLSVASTEDHTFEATWSYGAEVPPGGNASARLLACRLAGDLTPGDCGIPDGSSTISTEGVTLQLDVEDMLAGGTTGIALVELWIGSIPKGGGRIFDPGAAREWHRVGR